VYLPRVFDGGAGSLTRPTDLRCYDRRIDHYLGSRRLEVRTWPGHTGGDSIVVVPDAPHRKPKIGGKAITTHQAQAK
jgi:hypothetical protein